MIIMLEDRKEDQSKDALSFLTGGALGK